MVSDCCPTSIITAIDSDSECRSPQQLLQASWGSLFSSFHWWEHHSIGKDVNPGYTAGRKWPVWPLQAQTCVLMGLYCALAWVLSGTVLPGQPSWLCDLCLLLRLGPPKTVISRMTLVTLLWGKKLEGNELLEGWGKAEGWENCMTLATCSCPGTVAPGNSGLTHIGTRCLGWTLECISTCSILRA